MASGGRHGRGMVAGRAGPPRRGGTREAALPPKVQAAIREGLALERSGDAAGASARFAELAAQSHERGFAVPATRFQLRAALDAYQASGPDAAVTAGTLAASYAAGMPLRRRAVRLLAKLVRRLEADGHAAQAQALTQAIQSALAVSTLKGGDLLTVNRAQRRMLPGSCHACGAPVAADDIEFDDDGADCPYCGAGLL